jgi:hypothetical protein
MQFLLVTLSTILVFIAPLTYIASILRNETKPHRMTKVIIFFVTALNFAGIMAVHGNIGALIFSGMLLLQSAVITGLTLWKGVGGTSKIDYTCLVIAIIGVIGWKLTGNPILGISFSILADLAAYIPTFIKTWQHPSTETPWYYAIGTVSALLGLLAYKIELGSLFQIYIVAANIVMFICIYHNGVPKVNKSFGKRVTASID